MDKTILKNIILELNIIATYNKIVICNYLKAIV